MSMLNEMAGRVGEQLAEEYEVPREEALSAGFLSLLSAILQALMQFLQGCTPDPGEGLTVARRPGWGARLRVRATVRDQLGRGPGRRFGRDAEELKDAILTVARGVSEEEMRQLYKETKK
jgi:hypothetical protein